MLVATPADELGRLNDIAKKAMANDAGDIRPLSQKEASELEPNVRCVGALLSPETGIVDVHELMYSHKKQAIDHGA